MSSSIPSTPFLLLADVFLRVLRTHKPLIAKFLRGQSRWVAVTIFSFPRLSPSNSPLYLNSSHSCGICNLFDSPEQLFWDRRLFQKFSHSMPMYEYIGVIIRYQPNLADLLGIEPARIPTIPINCINNSLPRVTNVCRKLLRTPDTLYFCVFS